MTTFLALTPPQYLNAPEHVDIQQALGGRVTDLQAFRDDFLKQMRIETATWGLERYFEPVYGMPTDLSKSYAFRRSRVLAKKRGHGTTTKEMIENVAAAFTTGTVEVVEYPREYRFVVQFSGALGVPENIDDLTAAIEEIKPAHLAFEYQYTYRTYGDLKAYTHGDLKAYTYGQMRAGDLGPPPGKI